MASQAWTRALLFLVPLVMAFARRASTLMLAVTALATLFQNRNNVAHQWRSARFDGALLAGLAVLILWGGVSLAWSPLPARGLKQLVFDFALPMACGLWLLCMPQEMPTSKARRGFALAMTVAAILVALQIYFKWRIEALFNPSEQPGEAWRFNMVVVTYTLFLPVLLQNASRASLASVAACVGIITASALSQSATAKMSLIVCALAYPIGRFLPRKLSLSLFAVALLTLLVIQPWQGQLFDELLRITQKQEILFNSAKERIVIWQATGMVALDALPWGTGMGSSDAVSDGGFAKTLPPELWVGLRQTHAHNAFLNILMELGLPGVIGMALIAFGIVRTLACLPDALYVPSLALALQVIIVDLISHGAWQAWWFTAIMLGILALKTYAPQDDQSA